MTKENRERQYKNFRDIENNYVAAPGRNHDLEKDSVMKGRAKIRADEMLKKHPELSELDVKEVVEETKPEEKESGKKRKR